MRRWLLFVAFGGWTCLARAEVPAILQRMLDAADTLTYRGVVVQIEGKYTQSLSLLHRPGANGGQDELHSLQGHYWELQRTGDACRVGLVGARPARDEALVAAMFPSMVPRRLRHLVDYFEFQPIGKGRVAGRDADFTLARPRDQYRLPRLLVTDAATGLLLKASLLDERGVELRQAFFASLEIAGEPSPSWEKSDPAASQALTWAEYRLDRHPLGKELPWRLGRLPPGFWVDDYRREEAKSGGQAFDHITVSNGLSTVAVFIEAASNPAPSPTPGQQQAPRGLHRVGPLNALATTVSGHQVTLIGTVPNAVLEDLASGLAPAQAAAAGAESDSAAADTPLKAVEKQ